MSDYNTANSPSAKFFFDEAYQKISSLFKQKEKEQMMKFSQVLCSLRDAYFPDKSLREISEVTKFSHESLRQWFRFYEKEVNLNNDLL